MKLDTEHFEMLTWHDNTLHSISLVDENFNNDLILDIDYIMEWKNVDGVYQFLIAPAHLIFHEVSALRINLVQDEMQTMFSYLSTINSISREALDRGRYRWVIHLLGIEHSSISFDSSGFTLNSYKEPIISAIQHLTTKQRSC